MGDFFDDYIKKCIDDKMTEAWKNCANYTGFTGATGTSATSSIYAPMVKGIRKIFEDAYVPLNLKEKTFLEQIVEIEDED
jgi:hypothetical protein